MEEKIKLQIRNMKKHYKNGDGVENINMDVREGEFLTMLGPSGCENPRSSERSEVSLILMTETF